jgi:TPR repeat protein
MNKSSLYTYSLGLVMSLVLLWTSTSQANELGKNILIRKLAEHPLIVELYKLESEARVEQFHRHLEKAQTGDVLHQFVVGKAYQRGIGVGEKHTEALFWLRKSAEQGLAKGQLHYALALRSKPQALINDKKINEWIKKAADQGYPRALYLRGSSLMFSRAQSEALV